MFKHETFSNAPITEALIDVRVTFESAVKLDQLEKLSEKFSTRFPIKKTQIAHEYAVKVTDAAGGAESHTKSEILGHVRFTENRDKAVQLRVNGFAFSKLKPYESWPALRDETREHWETYRAELGPSRIARLAVRYINRIELALPITEFEDYILTCPRIAHDIPQGLAEFFFRVVVPNPDDEQMRAIITSTMEKLEQDKKVLPYIFDIDAFMPVDLDPTDEEIWPAFERLRDYKNLIFFHSTTEKAKEMFR